MTLREQADQQVAMDTLKTKQRVQKEEFDKKKRYQEALKVFEDKRFIVKWVNIDQKGILYEGYIEEGKIAFTIKRGLSIYTLYIQDKKLISEQKDQSFKTSIQLNILKEQAAKLTKKYLPKEKLALLLR